MNLNQNIKVSKYPGISQTHILPVGKEEHPEMKLFYGAIG